MDLGEYLKRNLIQQKDFAAILDIEANWLCRIIRKKCLPSRKLARRIEQHTGGKIKASDLRKDAPVRKRGPRIKQMTLQEAIKHHNISPDDVYDWGDKFEALAKRKEEIL